VLELEKNLCSTLFVQYMEWTNDKRKKNKEKNKQKKEKIVFFDRNLLTITTFL